ncbi:hypothetical protein C3F34_13410 [Acinetobacter sp. ACNIH2]|uniref:hypothetical protein n=1 Tax=Acinetobacter sp. ACNIH2 TaxID=1758189 RepID=UPI000CDCC43D|nr:hypothetical protein [Acinetobacter sp. ACNIH2]AUX86932.1 hypothetical protein C3F34_13410 [Acinetobacter sp. ACNIH2]
MKGKYWYTLYFILAFLILFSTVCIVYLTFNPLDEDTLKQSQATDLIYIFSGVSTFLAPLVILFTLSDWKNERRFDKEMEIFEQILNNCEKLNSIYVLKRYFNAELLKAVVNKHLSSFSSNNLIKNNYFEPSSLTNIISYFDDSFIDHDNSIFILEIYRDLLNKITILQSIKYNEKLSREIGTIMSLINSKGNEYVEFISFFNTFNNKIITFEIFQSQVLNQAIFNEQNNYNKQKEILEVIQRIRIIIRDEIKTMMN